MLYARRKGLSWSQTVDARPTEADASQACMSFIELHAPRAAASIIESRNSPRTIRGSPCSRLPHLLFLLTCRQPARLSVHPDLQDAERERALSARGTNPEIPCRRGQKRS